MSRAAIYSRSHIGVRRQPFACLRVALRFEFICVIFIFGVVRIDVYTKRLSMAAMSMIRSDI